MNVFTKGTPVETEVTIDVIAMLQYENGIDPTRFRLKLVDNNAAKHYFDLSTNDRRVDAARVVSNMSTYNGTNEASTTKRGNAYVKVQSGSRRPVITYKPLRGFQGVDSFYYIFEILDSEGKVIRRSTLGKITVDVYGAVAAAPLSTNVSGTTNNQSSS